MAMDVHFSFTVSVPELETLRQTLLTLGAQVMASLEGITAAIDGLVEQQAQGSEAISEQLTIIATEISQWTPESVTQAELDALASRVQAAADTAAQQAADIRANSQQITTIVPDTPAPPA
jgi:hypothetical protein